TCALPIFYLICKFMEFYFLNRDRSLSPSVIYLFSHLFSLDNGILYYHFHPDALLVTAIHAPNAYRILEYPTTLNYPWQTPQPHHLRSEEHTSELQSRE